MLTEDQLRVLMRDLESDRVERTVSTKKYDKFAEAICAFANDLPGSRSPGYLLVGVQDNGEPSGLRVDDNLLKLFGGIRSDGKIQPLPTLVVDKVSLADGSGDVVIVTVLPSDLPPVRYEGRVWIRVGPRKAIASEAEERILSERRTVLARTFDARPCAGASMKDLVAELFLAYRRRAVDPEVIQENHRSLEHQLASLRFFDLDRECPTNAGVLLFGVDPRSFLESAYVHFVRFAGVDLGSEVILDQVVAGDLFSVLRDVDSLIGVSTGQHPVTETILRERTVHDYPKTALRELVINAIVHRTYEASGPVRVHWFADRVEIQSPGGLYGEATPENFPTRNAYRNPVLAEALRVLGYVNRYGRGVERAQRALADNGSPPAEFVFDAHYVQVTVRRAS